MRHRHSDYMYWAKTQSRGRFNLATSGVGSFPLAELPRQPALEINGDSTMATLFAASHRPQMRRRSGLRGGRGGTSMANHLAMAALVEPGDEVLIEHPAYELLVSAALFLGARVRRFARTVENGFALDPAAIRGALTPKTKLVVVTNLHNPSSALTPDAALRRGWRSGAQRGRARAGR